MGVRAAIQKNDKLEKYSKNFTKYNQRKHQGPISGTKPPQPLALIVELLARTTSAREDAEVLMDSRWDMNQQQALMAMKVNPIPGCISRTKGSGLRGVIVNAQHSCRLIWNTESGFQVTPPFPLKKRCWQPGESPEGCHHDSGGLKKNPREAERGRLVSCRLLQKGRLRELDAAQSDKSFLPLKGEGHR